MRALVLLHGWGMTPSVFGQLIDRLQTVYTVHAIALPGYCGAPSVSLYTIESLARSVAARAPPRCIVAGWSLGGQVALEWARVSPQQVQSLVVIGATPSFVQRTGWPHAVERGVFEAFAASMAASRDATLTRFASLQAQGDAAMKEAVLRLRAGLAAEADASTATLQDGLRVLLDTDLRESLGGIEQEALVIHGEYDRLAPFAAAEHLARALKRGRLCAVPGAAHAPFASRVGVVAAALKDFLQ